MKKSIFSFQPFGYEGSIISVECDLRRGIPAVDIVGIADSSVKECRERILSVFKASEIDFPSERVLLALSPCDLKKDGSGHDLPIALSIYLESKEKDEETESENILSMGELELSGRIRNVRGIYAALSTATSYGIKKFILPDCKETRDYAKEFNGIKVIFAESFRDAIEKLENDRFELISEEKDVSNGIEFRNDKEMVESFEDKHYSKTLIEKMTVFMSGNFNALFIGAPGCGKTIFSSSLPLFKPSLTVEEKCSTERIWNLAGLGSIGKFPPFRMPHQTASIEGICGGGPNCRPGEISLSHNGILFLDEASEFRTSVLQMLRVPLESKRITLSRAGRSTVYPANFQLIMATNPCPCGNYGNKDRICLCSAKSVQMFWNKFSAPLLDRVEFLIDFVKDNSEKSTYTVEDIQETIRKAVILQRERQGKLNHDLTPYELNEILEKKNLSLSLRNKYFFEDYSPRRNDILLKVALTLSDIEESSEITEKHLEKAREFVKPTVYGQF